MADIRNLLRESIIDVKKLKQASALTTKDMLLTSITEDVKKRLHLDDFGATLLEDIFTEDLDTDILDIMGLSDLELFDDLITLQVLLDLFLELTDILQMDLQEIDDLILLLLSNIVLEELEAVYDNLIEDIIELLLNDISDLLVEDIVLDDLIDDLILDLLNLIDDLLSAYTQDVMDLQFPDLTDEDLEILLRIREILLNEDSVDDLLLVITLKCDLVDKLRKLNRQLRQYHKQVTKHINLTKNIKLRGLYAKKIFERYLTLTRNQKIKIILNFDRANSLRLIKLVYATLMLGLKSKKDINKKKRSSYASGKTGSTRSRISLNLEYKDIDLSLNEVRSLFKKRVGL